MTLLKPFDKLRASKNWVKMLGIFAVILFVGVIYLALGVANKNKQIACTQEAKLCPDGTYVGRTGPNCEFTKCPDEISLQTKYITAEKWPPNIEVTADKFSCKEGGSEIMISGQTTKRTIDGREYCVSIASEGAAGSVYTSYIYATEKDGKLVTINFTLRAVQCANYDDPQKSECERERASFNPDGIVDNMMTNIKLN